MPEIPHRKPQIDPHLFPHRAAGLSGAGMKILVVTATYTPSINGVAAVVSFQKQGLENRGHQFWVLAPHHSQQKDEKHVIRLPSLPNPFIPDYPLLLPFSPESILSKVPHPDLIYFHHPFHIGQTGLALARHFSVPSVFFYHTQYEFYFNTYLPSFLPRHALAQILNRTLTKLLNQTSCIITGTESIRKQILTMGIKPPVKVIPNFRRHIQPVTTPIPKLRQKYHLHPTLLTLICVARLSPEKNLGTLLKLVSL